MNEGGSPDGRGTGRGRGVGRGRGQGGGQAAQATGRLFSDILLSPHRVFFTLAGLWAVIALGWWQWGYDLGLPVPSLGTSTLWHAHEMTVGFGGACMAAFFLTAMPNWTGGRRLTGTGLAALAGVWLFARIALALGERLPLGVVLAPGLVFYAVFAGLFARAVWAQGMWQRSFLPFTIALLGLADAAFIASATGWLAWPDPAQSTRILVLFFAVKVSVIAGGMTPAFTANSLRQKGEGPMPRLHPLANRTGLVLLLAALAATLANRWTLGAGLLIAAGLAQLWRMWGWRGLAVRGYAPAAMLHLSFAWLPPGLVLTGLACLFPLPWRESDTIHALMMGAMGGLALSIAARAAARRDGAELRLGPALLIAFGAIWTAALTRLAAPIWFDAYEGLLNLAAGLWCAGWGAFVLGYRPALTGPVPRPVFNADGSGRPGKGPAGQGGTQGAWQ
ncbi:uncharacterized protein involved in response to NO [Rhodovulum bhavnagarense]|uniref:Uncharacterized protein involved in response to NO n=1 Tax=Rhodovulum bhavnagarense TaxID=992286 RepID=A0A4R2RJ48_9RHOB|nr:NnrS family protein [Rhodovulum bhavnagarense]TCP62884.1 uncharacterized protein involved in response to NO [Rhodovulum bhavnagarense]